MKTKTLKLTAILLILAGVFTACNGNEPKPEEPCPCEDKEIFTRPFFVRNVIWEECGHLLFLDTGCLGHFHGYFLWAKNLPKEYQIDRLRVLVTHCVIEYNAWNTYCIYHIIHITEILKQCEQPFIQ